MAVGDATIGFGGTVEVDDGGGGAFVEIDAVLTLGVPTITTGTVESKRLASDFIKKLATVNKGESLSIKQEFTNAGYARMEALRDRATHRFRFTIPDDNGDTVITAPCIVTANKVADMESDKITEFDTMLEIADDLE
jgi:hypothetical protein